MANKAWNAEQLEKSGVEILLCLQKLHEACGFDEGDSQATFLEWLSSAVHQTTRQQAPDDPDWNTIALAALAFELYKMKKQADPG